MTSASPSRRCRATWRPSSASRPSRERHDTTPGAVAIAWTLTNPAVDGAIVGFRRPEQVDPLLAAARPGAHAGGSRGDRRGLMSAPANTSRRPGRPRSERARQAILRAAADLLLDEGTAQVSMDAVAERAGVSKATIYRWWPSKERLALDALLEWAATGSSAARHRLAARGPARARAAVGARDPPSAASRG